MFLQGYILINPLQLHNHRQSSIHEHFKQTQNICKESELEGKILLPIENIIKQQKMFITLKYCFLTINFLSGKHVNRVKNTLAICRHFLGQNTLRQENT
jgi:hypothetical protein